VVGNFSVVGSIHASTTGTAVTGISTSADQAGVYAESTSSSGFALRAKNGAGGWAGYFEGDTKVVGNFTVGGNLTKSGGTFKIDHPLDPRNKYLYHSFVESPDMMNIYNGNVTTDDKGYATVGLPEWFEALNREFRYQLTVIGQFAQAIVAKKIEGNSFTIQTDKPAVEVSWQVTGIRKDAYAEKNRIKVEVEKTDKERGTCIFPEACRQ
jgi:hypothetical protein